MKNATAPLQLHCLNHGFEQGVATPCSADFAARRGAADMGKAM